MNANLNWYAIKNIEDIDSPSVVIYAERMISNIELAISMVNGDIHRLMPHVKTNKIKEVIEEMVKHGIYRIKASTIAEAELAASAGIKHILIAHQLVGPKIDRYFRLKKNFSDTQFSIIVDNIEIAKIFEFKSVIEQTNTSVYIDLNNGMNRTGIRIGKELDQLINYINQCKKLHLSGLHIYDGHHRDPELNVRKDKLDSDFEPIKNVFEKLQTIHHNVELVCGGSPSFTTHLQYKERICSPGTFIFWDAGYESILQEQKFKMAALVICRIISKPTEGIITTDLGHKAIAAEKTIDQRVKFLNMKGNHELISQSEEHGVIQVDHWDKYKVGDVLYGIPYHVCPTVNLYQEVSVIENTKKTKTWNVAGRSRKISI